MSGVDMKPTPGPWVVRDDDFGDWTGRICDLGWGIIVTRASGPPDDIPDAVESRANARLIAAAPEILAVLAQLRDEWFEPHYGHNDVGMAVLLRDKIRAVLAKAEGC